MPTLNILKLYADNTVLTEAQLDAIRTSIETFLNTTKIDADNIQDNSIPKEKFTAATRQFLCPVGFTGDYPSGSVPPAGWLYCDGSLISKTTYADLFAVLSTDYMTAADISAYPNDFRLPDLRSRTTVGRDDMDNPVGTGGGAANRIQQALEDIEGDPATSADLGASGGEETHTLEADELAAHEHDEKGDHNHPFSSTSKTPTIDHVHSVGDYYIPLDFNSALGKILTKRTTYDPWISNISAQLISFVDPDASVVTGIVDVIGNSGPPTTAEDTVTGTVSVNTDKVEVDDTSQSRGEAHNNLQPMIIMNKIIKY